MRSFVRFVLCLLCLTAAGTVFADPYPISGTAIENSLPITLMTRDVASANFYALNQEKLGFVNAKGEIVDLEGFFNALTSRLNALITLYPGVRGYGLFFVGIKFTPNTIKKLQTLLLSIQVPDKKIPLSQALLQLGFTDNSVTNREIKPLIQLITLTPNLTFLDIANNQDCDRLTALILALNGLHHFLGLDTRLTKLDSQSNIFLLRSILQSNWNGVAMSVNDVFQANALQEVLKRKHLNHLGIHIEKTVGRKATDALLHTLVQTQTTLEGLHLGVPEDYPVKPEESHVITRIIEQNKNLHTLTLDMAQMRYAERKKVYQVLNKKQEIYGLGLSSNFFLDPDLKAVVNRQNFLVAIQPIGELSSAEIDYVGRLVAQRATCVDTSRLVTQGQWKDVKLDPEKICSTPAGIKKQKNTWNTLDRINPP